MTKTALSRSYKDVSFEDFDPNDPDSFGGLWMVYEGWHSVRFYAQRGNALNRCHHGSHFKLYEQVSGRWELRANAPDVTKDAPRHCDICRKVLVRNAYYSSRNYMSDNEGVYKFERDHNSKVKSPLVLEFLCKGCL